MKLIFIFLISIFFTNCSFDNKSGIWTNENIDKKKQSDLFKDFKKISLSEKKFNEIIYLDDKFKFKLKKPIKNFKWNDIYYNKNNNLHDFYYQNQNTIEFKSKKISKGEINPFFLIDKNNLITSDHKGNIITFALESGLIDKYNFYKNEYKKVKKKLNIIVEDQVVYVSDNLGYLYAYDYSKSNVIWAKNYKVPFRSNLKIINNKLIASNQNDQLFFFDKKNGQIIKSIPSEETTIKNEFVNNLSLDKTNLFFLNSFGSLYSIDTVSMDIKWFINLNQSFDLNPSNLFLSNQIVNTRNKVVISSNYSTYIIDSKNGNVLSKKNFSSNIRPIILDNYIFFITKNNLLISMDLDENKILYSYNVDKLIANFLDTKKKQVKFKSFMIMNNEIFIFLENSYIINLKINGELIQLKKLPSKMNSVPINIDGSILFLDKNNKLIAVN